ncbi:MAG: alpha-amylase family glycosyl hydrolase [Solirubrobacteraceae bacterium]
MPDHLCTPGWWSGAVGYELYVRSFADGNADGLGDLIGAREHLEHLAWLGVDAVWLTPFYPSPGRDAGYDISDHCAVDPALGTLEDFDRLLARARELGLRVLIDIVPNHTSSEHPWFRSALEGPDSPHRDYYVWREPKDGGAPPNNWVANFGGPAWTRDPAGRQHYLHLFLPEQPDLNWELPAVDAEFRRILRFWRDRGVDGFRIDVAHMLRKDPALRDNPPARRTTREPGTVEAWDRFEHVHDLDQDGVLDIYRGWRTAVPDALLLGEVYLLDPVRTTRYVQDGDGLDLTFWFGPMVADWSAASLRRALREPDALASGRIAWVAGNHDGARPASRLGGGPRGRRRSLCLFTLLALLPGMAFLYQGDELGLQDGVVEPADARDPIAVHGREPAAGRDGARTPIPWRTGHGWGFTTAPRPWLPYGQHTERDTVAWQREHPDSWLHRHRRLLEVRRQLRRDGAHGVPQWLAGHEDLVAYRRDDVLVAANLGSEPATVPPAYSAWQVRFSSLGRDAGSHDGVVAIDEALVLERGRGRGGTSSAGTFEADVVSRAGQ